MRIFFLLCMTYISISAQASTVTVRGNGYSSNYCDGMNSFWCVDSIKQTARRDALSRADFDCRMRGGQSHTYSAYCSIDFCNPSYIPSNATLQYVTCRSDCSMDCEIKD